MISFALDVLAHLISTLALSMVASAQVADAPSSGIDSCETLSVQVKYSGLRPICVMTLTCQEWTDGIQLRHFARGEVAGCAPLGRGACPDDGVKCLADKSVTVEDMDHLTEEPRSGPPPCDSVRSGNAGAAR